MGYPNDKRVFTGGADVHPLNTLNLSSGNRNLYPNIGAYTPGNSDIDAMSEFYFLHFLDDSMQITGDYTLELAFGGG